MIDPLIVIYPEDIANKPDYIANILRELCKEVAELKEKVKELDSGPLYG